MRLEIKHRDAVSGKTFLYAIVFTDLNNRAEYFFGITKKHEIKVEVEVDLERDNLYKRLQLEVVKEVALEEKKDFDLFETLKGKYESKTGVKT
jgi:hypothetical protein